MKKLLNFIKRDHPYVYLGGAVLGALGIKMASMQPSQLSFLGSSPLLYILAGICGLFILLALAALAVKLSHWKSFSATAFKSPAMVKAARYFSYVLCVAVLLLFIDRPLMSFSVMAGNSTGADRMPDGFVPVLYHLLKRFSTHRPNGKPLFMQKSRGRSPCLFHVEYFACPPYAYLTALRDKNTKVSVHFV